MMNRIVCWFLGHRPMSLKVKIGTKPDQLTGVTMTFCGRCDADLPPPEPRPYPSVPPHGDLGKAESDPFHWTPEEEAHWRSLWERWLKL